MVYCQKSDTHRKVYCHTHTHTRLCTASALPHTHLRTAITLSHTHVYCHCIAYGEYSAQAQTTARRIPPVRAAPPSHGRMRRVIMRRATGSWPWSGVWGVSVYGPRLLRYIALPYSSGCSPAVRCTPVGKERGRGAQGGHCSAAIIITSYRH